MLNIVHRKSEIRNDFVQMLNYQDFQTIKSHTKYETLLYYFSSESL